LPEGVKAEKYTPSADVAVALAKYSAGLPFYRLARVQAAFGVPLPESVQFERCQAVADCALPVYLHLRQMAAQGEVIFGDDTGVKILDCLKENKKLTGTERLGTQTTGLVIEVEGRRIALYASGRRHAGENIDELLRQRREGLPPPIQMGDALSRNWSRDFKTIVTKCLAHARRQFVEIEEVFPEECGRVLDDLAAVYGVEAETRGMTADERLAYHQRHSGPVLSALEEWIKQELAERRVEPNSNLGRALGYLQRHWDGLTQILRVAGAPIDNNVCERALKLAVLARKNSLFYKTEHGAAVGDLLQSLIGSCRLNDVSPWSYLLAVVSNAKAVRQNPAAWLPWNYAEGEDARRAA
jgi:transposase